MQHFVYAMNGSMPAPASGGTTRAWFFHYKWDTGGEVFVPVPELVGKMPEPGDLLWFLMDTHPIGYAPVLRTQEDPGNGFVEVYYDTQDIRAGSTDDLTYSCSYSTGLATGSIVKFFEELKQAFDLRFSKRPEATPPPVPAPEDTTSV